jgi:hypothetical protein
MKRILVPFVRLLEAFVIYTLLSVVSGCTTVPVIPQTVGEVDVVSIRQGTRVRCKLFRVYLIGANLSTVCERLSIDDGYGNLMDFTLNTFEEVKELAKCPRARLDGTQAVMIYRHMYQVRRIAREVYGMKDSHNVLAFYSLLHNTIYVSEDIIEPYIMAHELAHMMNDSVGLRNHDLDEEIACKVEYLYLRKHYGEN